MTQVAIIDYGMGNLRSVAKAVEHVSPRTSVTITSDPDVVLAAERVIFPGQGAMPDCMRELDRRGLREAVVEASASRPFLGVCLGLQMLFEHSEEGGSVAGLGILPGQVRRFQATRADETENAPMLKVPHMGWNRVHQCGAHPLWEGIADGERFYFVHSYHVVPAEAGQVAAETDYGVRFACAAARGNIFAVQFHPEKSAQAGLQLLSNFLRWAP